MEVIPPGETLTTDLTHWGAEQLMIVKDRHNYKYIEPSKVHESPRAVIKNVGRGG